jgi:hypothetical protein
MRPAAFAVIGAGLLSWGLLENKMLLIVAGLLFLPLMPTLVRVGFGMLSREWSLRAGHRSRWESVWSSRLQQARSLACRDTAGALQ